MLLKFEIRDLKLLQGSAQVVRAGMGIRWR